jgi:RNA polymerase sigma factor (sigma-70 family)
MELQQETELVERARGDPRAFGELYERFYSPIFNYALKRTASIETAKDVTSEVFLKAFKNLKQFHYRGLPFSAWLYRIATNEIANQHRHNGRRTFPLEDVSTPLVDPSPPVDDELIAAEAELERSKDFLALHAHIARLPVHYQEVIVLRFFENKSLKEVGMILGKRDGTVKSLLHRGLEKLRALME